MPGKAWLWHDLLSGLDDVSVGELEDFVPREMRYLSDMAGWRSSWTFLEESARERRGVVE
jgi:hypothetical protein